MIPSHLICFGWLPKVRWVLVFGSAILAGLSGAGLAAARDAALPGGVMEFRSVPRHTPSSTAVDGPLLGNGDMKVAVGGGPEGLRYFLGKNDFWRLKHGYGNGSPLGFGELVLQIPELEGASYFVRQPIGLPRTEGEFSKDGLFVRQTAVVAADRNLLWIRLESEGRAVEVRPVLKVTAGRGSKTLALDDGGVLFGRRSFDGEVVDIPSGVAVAAKVIGTELSEAVGPAAQPSLVAAHQVQIGREQFRGGRWGFDGRIEELAIYDTALKEPDVKSLVTGEGSAKPAFGWEFHSLPEGAHGVGLTEGRVGKALGFSGASDCRIDVGELNLPVQPVSVAGWIFIDGFSREANYILSCGEWNKGVSLGLSAGKLRFAVNGRHAQSRSALPKGEWIHVAGVFEDSGLKVFVNGKMAGQGVAGPVGRSEVASHRFTLEPGKPVDLVLTMDSLLDSASYDGRVREALAGVTRGKLAAIAQAHADWWTTYWTRSSVDLGDPVLELGYYRGLYTMGACSRNPRFPPGIFGWDTTDHPSWEGDYHLNYNHFAPYYGLYSSNRIEQADPEDAPLIDFMGRGRWYAGNVTRTRGVLFPVGIGPLGIETTNGSAKYMEGANAEQGGLFFQQRSNSAYSLVNIAQRWRCTYDPDYAGKVYPLVREVACFWEDYLVFEEGRYVIHGDAVHEGSGQDVNPVLSLGLVKNAFDLALDMSNELGVDGGLHEKWRHILRNLSSWTVQERNGKHVFRYTEKGTAWWQNNTLGVQHIYPGNAIGFDSDSRWLEVGRNTIDEMGRWTDHNGTTSFFPAAVRVGCDPAVILDKLAGYVANQYPNGFTRGNPHGIENTSTVPNTVNEMLCMSHVPVGDPDRAEAVIRVFPVWPKDRDASFRNIRTWGAFLVSADLKGGQVQSVKITSERGRRCTVVNPWPGEDVVITGEGRVETLRGGRVAFDTEVGEVVILEHP